MAKVDVQAAINELKAKSVGKRKNYTFRLPKELMDKFVKYCEGESVTPTGLLETIIKQIVIK